RPHQKAEDQSPTMDLVIPPSAVITLDGIPAKIEDLRPEMEVYFVEPQGDEFISTLEVFSSIADGKPHTSQGPIEKISPQEFVLLAGRHDLFPSSVAITSGTTVTIDGQPAKVSDLRRRMFVVVNYKDENASSISAVTVARDGKPHHVDGIVSGLQGK